jgi:hypothetical protein
VAAQDRLKPTCRSFSRRGSVKKRSLSSIATRSTWASRPGFSINGFGEAASAYFNKDVTNLTLSESAFLAGLIRSPNRYNPYTKVDTATARRNQVLDSMAEAGAITQDEAAKQSDAASGCSRARPNRRFRRTILR